MNTNDELTHEAIILFETLVTDCMSSRPEEIVKSIVALVLRGKATWKELGFTKKELYEQERLAKVREAKRKFESLKNDNLLLNSLEKIVNRILALVSRGVTTWKELGFTKKELYEQERLAKVREAKRKFESLNTDSFFNLTPPKETANSILALISREGLTEKELGFTKKELYEQERLAKVREAKRKFESLKNEDCPLVANICAEYITTLILKKETTWEELGFTEHEVNEHLLLVKERDELPLDYHLNI